MKETKKERKRNGSQSDESYLCIVTNLKKRKKPFLGKTKN